MKQEEFNNLLFPQELYLLLNDFPNSNVNFLVTGITGWFGKTAISILKTFRQVKNLHFEIYGQHRNKLFRFKNFEIIPTNFQEVSNSNFYLIDAAGVNKPANNESQSKFAIANRECMQNSVFWLKNQKCKHALVFTSGAELTGVNSEDIHLKSYSKAKHENTELWKKISKSNGVPITKLRVWSVSGGYVKNPSQYLFSDLTLMAIKGNPLVTSDLETQRRYMLLDEALILSIKESFKNESFHTFDTGGILTTNKLLASSKFSISKDSVDFNSSRYLHDDFPNLVVLDGHLTLLEQHMITCRILKHRIHIGEAL